MSTSPRTIVLGAGIVGRAAAWDLVRRGHEVTLADVDAAEAHLAATAVGAQAATVDAADGSAVEDLISGADAVVAAVPYSFGVSLAAAAIATGCHYFDFGGNPTIVKRQLRLNEQATDQNVAVVPDCGLAPGVANVMAAGLIEEASGRPIDSVQIRVGCLPQHPTGSLQYQLAFYPGGLINEYAEPCEVIAEGVATTVDPLTRFEEVAWDEWGPLEAFSTAGGTSTMCQDYEGRVQELEYKTLRYPGHGAVFHAMRELGLFDEQPRRIGDLMVAPRPVLLDLLAEHLPAGEPDVVLVRVEVVAGGVSAVLEIEDIHDGRFSALARTTAYPATALCDLVVRGDADYRGAGAMCAVAPPGLLMEELQQVGVTAVAVATF
ncbi:MAG: saccharopine dehydrogenase C-terminal domain-containing protein [Acidimicrobiia bacterium]|nr:saccharopine dehydrogenase C-terminal domain-containing protein [Acidimicrobiia bacterium]